MDKYFVVSSIDHLEGHYAVKVIESDRELNIKNKKFSFGIDGESLLYIGREVEFFHRYEKVSFFLSRYKTKINKNIYKVDLTVALGRVAYGCEILFISNTLKLDFLQNAVNLESLRINAFENPKELLGSARNAIEKKYDKLEDVWLSYWISVKERLIAFYRKHPKPLKKNYYRSGLWALIFGKFKQEEYESDRHSHFRKLDWVTTKIAENAKELDLSFTSKCPNCSGEKVDFHVDFPSDVKDGYYYLDDNFPYGIYKKLNMISGACSECGSFKLTFTDEDYTCMFVNYFDEYIYYTIKKIVDYTFAKSIEKDLFGISE